jgi:hypothetical protein
MVGYHGALIEDSSSVCGALSTAGIAVRVGTIPMYSVEAVYGFATRGHWDSKLCVVSKPNVLVKSKPKNWSTPKVLR